MAYIDSTETGQAPSTPLPVALAAALPTHRGWTNAGLRRRAIGRWTYEVTGGTEDPANTHDLTVGGSSILGSAVQQAASNNATATAIATAVNANTATTGFYATVSSATVTIRQRRSGAKTLVKVVTGDATGTLTAAFASTDTWTEHASGATFDGDEYYELSWSGAVVVDTPGGVDLTNARLCHIRFKVTGQAFQLWSGMGVQTSSNTILTGNETAADTWTNSLPWVDASTPLTVKLAADAALLYEALYI